jgi:hypothetical protein
MPKVISIEQTQETAAIEDAAMYSPLVFYASILGLACLSAAATPEYREAGAALTALIIFDTPQYGTQASLVRDAAVDTSACGRASSLSITAGEINC